MNLKQLFCRHRLTTSYIFVSGYGYTEYTVWFCKRCEKLLWRQTRHNH